MPTIEELDGWAIDALDGSWPVMDLPERELVLRWVLEEMQEYSNKKFNKLDRSDPQQQVAQKSMRKDGFLSEGFWSPQILQYLDRAKIFGVADINPNPAAGRQAIMKMLVTLFDACACMILVHGLPPAPGQTSGETSPWDLSVE